VSEVKVNKISPRSGTNVQLGDSGDTITIPSGATFAGTQNIANSALTGSGQITINGQAVALGGSITLTTETRPTVSGISPSTIENTQTSVVITGTNFVSVPLVTAINSTTGAQFTADEVSFTSSTSITAKFTISVDASYKLYVENPDGNAVQTGALLTVSDAPAWQTAAGSLGSFAAGSTISTVTITATNATSFAVQSGSLPTGLSLNTGSGSATITGTVSSGITSDTLFSFTVRATDAEGQTADRAFTMQVTVGANNSGQFN
jgi:hypothetical protein